MKLITIALVITLSTATIFSASAMREGGSTTTKKITTTTVNGVPQTTTSVDDNGITQQYHLGELDQQKVGAINPDLISQFQYETTFDYKSDITSTSFIYNSREARDLTYSWEKSWNGYTVNISEEPVMREWVSGCPIGWEKANSDGRAARYCSRKYKFKTTNNVTVPREIGYVAPRSLKMPKGYLMNMKGAFIESFFQEQIQNKEITNLRNGSNSIVCERTGYVNNLIEFKYWINSLEISSTSYVKITRLVLQLFKTLINYQSSHQDWQHNNDKVETCTTTRTTTITHKQEEEVNYKSIQVQIQNLTKQIESYNSLIKLLQSLLQDQIEIKDYNKVIEQYKEEINKKKQQKKELEAQLTIINTQISVLTVELNSESSSSQTITTTTVEIETINKQIEEETKRKQQLMITIEEYHAKMIIYNSHYNSLKSTETNLKQESTSIETQIKLLQAQLEVNNKKIETNKKEQKKVIAQIDTADVQIKQTQTQIDSINTQITTHKKTITTKTETITTETKKREETQIKITKLEKEKIDIQKQINELDSEIISYQLNDNEGKSIITEEFRKKIKIDIESYQVKIVNIQKEIVTQTSLLEISQKKIDEYNVTIEETTNCINENNHKQVGYQSSSVTSITVTTQITEIITLVPSASAQQVDYLNSTKTLAENTSAKADFISNVKPILHKFLDSVPGNPEILADIMNELRRRRLRNKRRRRLI